MSESLARIRELGAAVLDGAMLSASQATELAALAQQEPHELMYWAHRLRRANFDDRVAFCSIVPGKLGGCSEDCKWCAQSSVACGRTDGIPSRPSPQNLPTARLIEAAQEAARHGARCFCIVNSGRAPSAKDFDRVLAMAREVQALGDTSFELSASLGELTPEQATALAAVGVRRYNHNLETSREFYPSVVGSHCYEDRLRTLRAAKAAGMALCCGGIFGIGETWADRVSLAMTLREVGSDVVPLNFLHAIPGTPLEGQPPLEPMEILTIIAFFRLLLPRTDLKIAGGRALNLRDLQSWVFYCGATSCIAGNLLTTTGRKIEDDLQMIRDLGLRVVAK